MFIWHSNNWWRSAPFVQLSMNRAFLTILYKLPYATVVQSIPAIHNQVCRILSVLCALEGPTYGPSSDSTVSFHGPHHQTCSVRFYTIMLKYQFIKNLSQSANWQCLNIESNINGFPPCQKIKNASLIDPTVSSLLPVWPPFFFGYIVWRYFKHWHFVLGLEW